MSSSTYNNKSVFLVSVRQTQTKFGNFSFATSSARQWNQLPVEMKDAENSRIFKSDALVHDCTKIVKDDVTRGRTIC
jgi:hypothetical protein